MTTPTDAQLDALWAEACKRHDLTRDMVRAFARAAIAAAHPQQPARVPLTEEQIVMDAIMMMPTSIASDCAKACEYGIRFAERHHGIVPAPTTDQSHPQR
jgi:hypothetical protein